MHNIYNTPADNIKKLYWKEFDGLIDVYTEHWRLLHTCG